MTAEPEIPLPVMTEYTEEGLGMLFSCPYIWEAADISENGEFSFVFASPYDGDNVWDMSNMYLDIYGAYEGDFLKDLTEQLESDGYEVQQTEIGGKPAIDAYGLTSADENGSVFRNRYIMIQVDEEFVSFDFYILDAYGTDADELFQSIADSIVFEQ